MLPLPGVARSGSEPPSVEEVAEEVVAVVPVLWTVDGSDMAVPVSRSITLGTDRDEGTVCISILVGGRGVIWVQVVTSPVFCVSSSESS